MPEEPQRPESHQVALAGAIGLSAAGIFFIAAMCGGGQLWPVTIAAVALAARGVGIDFLMSKNR